MMTGRDLIIYILQNNLEDTLVFEDGKILGFLTIEEVAVQFDVGIATIKVWLDVGYIKGVKFGDNIYIPVKSVSDLIKELKNKE